MGIDRVVATPHKEVYNPGDVINVAVYFYERFIGQCEVGLVPVGHPMDAPFRGTPCARSSDTLYEGQVYVRDSDVGVCRLRARLTPVRGEPRLVSLGDQLFWVRPLVPLHT